MDSGGWSEHPATPDYSKQWLLPRDLDYFFRDKREVARIPSLKGNRPRHYNPGLSTKQLRGALKVSVSLPDEAGSDSLLEPSEIYNPMLKRTLFS